jgi:hypothetical protein
MTSRCASCQSSDNRGLRNENVSASMRVILPIEDSETAVAEGHFTVWKAI